MSTSNTERATGASLAAIVFVLCGFVAVAVLHVLRTDLDPVREVMSGYANGRFGFMMTVAFYALGLACLALAVRLRRAISQSGVGRAVRVLLALSGLGLILAAVFEVERAIVPDTIEEVIHSNASLVAFALLIAAMLLFAVACRNDPRWADFRWIAAGLAVLAAIAGAASPISADTPWTGIAQRVLGLCVAVWLLLTALHIRLGGFRRSPRARLAGESSRIDSHQETF